MNEFIINRENKDVVIILRGSKKKQDQRDEERKRREKKVFGFVDFVFSSQLYKTRQQQLSGVHTQQTTMMTLALSRE